MTTPAAALMAREVWVLVLGSAANKALIIWAESAAVDLRVCRKNCKQQVVRKMPAPAEDIFRSSKRRLLSRGRRTKLPSKTQ